MGNFARGCRDPLAELDGLEHLGVRAELEQLAERLLEALEADGVDTVAALQVVRQLTDRKLACAERHLDTRPRRLERPRPFLPENAEVEVLGPLEALVAHAHGDEPRDAVDAHPG